MRSAVVTFLAIVAGMSGCSAPASDASPSIPDTATSVAGAERWYRKVRALDLTGDGQKDTVHLDADGAQPDSVRIVLRLLVDGEEKHRESWGSRYERALFETMPTDSAQGMELLRVRLDTILARVKGEPLDAPGVRLMAEDSAVMASIVPRPTFRVSISYGYETTVRLVWDSSGKRFVHLFSCC